VLPSSDVLTKRTKRHHTSSEITLAWYFTILYPLVLLLVAMTIYLVVNGYIPQAP